MISQLYKKEADYARELEEGTPESPWRSPFLRDYARIIHCASFRRLQGKTQVFPGHESDFFRNRLTHSLEVAQIAEGIAERLNSEDDYLKAHPLDGRICATAALLHDLGHPPFGHNGERALDNAMIRNGGFEGNAQTLRIVSRLEKKFRDEDGKRYGLNLTFRILAAAIKYDKKIPRSREKNAKLVKGYYATESDLVKKIKDSLLGGDSVPEGEFKTIECSIMDLADDIAYSTYDLEDSLKAGFLTPADMLASSDALLTEVAMKVEKELGRSFTAIDVLTVITELFSNLRPESVSSKEEDGFGIVYRASKELASSGYLRTEFSSQLVGDAIRAVKFKLNDRFPQMSKVKLNEKAKEKVEVLKQYTFAATIYSSRVKLPEYRGYEVVKGIFKALADPRGDLLMPEDVRRSYTECSDDHDEKMRVICDFVAGMTDRYAMEFYGRLHSDSAQSMFKPI